MKKKKSSNLRGMSIKKRITLWYAATVLVIAMICMAVMYLGTIQMTEAAVKERLSSAAQLAAGKVHIDASGKVQASDDLDHITEADILVLGKTGDIYYGSASQELIGLKMTDGTFQSVTVNGYRYYVYDTLVRVNAAQAVWIRSYASLSMMQLLGTSMIRIWVILIPFLLIFSALVGYLITGRAFRPIQAINETAEEIAQSGDLTKRITTQQMQKDELYRLSETFNQMFDKLQAAFESEKQFTSDASHELRTPVAVVMAQAEYLVEKFDAAEKTDVAEKADAAEKKAAEIILHQTNRMSKLITELLMISRMENNKLSLHEEEIDVSELVQMVQEEMEEQAQEKHITLETRLQEHVFLQADQTMLMRVFVNLIGNAIKYGKDGGFVRISVKQGENGKVSCSVADNGIGISPENQTKIWQRFYQVDPARTTDGSGSGLGLFMVKWIIEKYGGKITVESQEGEGSTFSFQI